MSSGTDALEALQEGLGREIRERYGDTVPEGLKVLLGAVKHAVSSMEDKDYSDYMGEDM